MTKEILTSPYDLVAEAIGADKNSVDDSSAMGEHPQWDSINQLHVIVALETAYNIAIPNDEMMKYSNMKAIVALYDEKTGRKKKPSLLKRLGNILKGFKI